MGPGTSISFSEPGSIPEAFRASPPPVLTPQPPHPRALCHLRGHMGKPRQTQGLHSPRGPRLEDGSLGFLIRTGRTGPQTPLTHPAPNTRSQLPVVSKGTSPCISWAGPKGGTSGDLAFQALSTPAWTENRTGRKPLRFVSPPSPGVLALPTFPALPTWNPVASPGAPTLLPVPPPRSPCDQNTALPGPAGCPP